MSSPFVCVRAPLYLKMKVMFLRRYLLVVKDPVWSKVITLSLALFFVMFADAVVSFWAPNLLQDAFQSSIVMGLVMGFSSIVGFVMDLVFPSLLRNITVRRMVLLAILTSLVTMLALFGASLKPVLFIFLLAMALWGVYYEFEAFACQQFVADSVPVKARSGAWGIIGVFKNLAYFLGPLVAAWLIIKGDWLVAIFILVLLWAGFVVITASGKSHEHPMEVDITEINLWREMQHWWVLGVHVWPAIIMSLLVGAIDAVFWTTGAVWTEALARQNPLGAMFLPLYSLPPLFLGVLMVKLGIYKGKKKLAEIFLILTGVVLAGLYFSGGVIWQLVIVLVSSIMLSIAFPLIEGVYSDIVARLGQERKHMIGLTSSVLSFAYIVMPPLAGFLTHSFGERMTFTLIGLATAVISFLLLFVTPKKLKLPQEEIKEWQD